MVARLREWAHRMVRDVVSLWFCCRDPRTPAVPRLLATLVVAYAFSPIDLIPDFIPVLGYLDELIVLPAAIYLVLQLVPAAILEENRTRAAVWIEARVPRPSSYVAAAVIVLIWVVLACLGWWAVTARSPKE